MGAKIKVISARCTVRNARVDAKENRLLSLISRKEIKCSPIKIGQCDRVSRGRGRISIIQMYVLLKNSLAFFYDPYDPLIGHDGRCYFSLTPFALTGKNRDTMKTIASHDTFTNDARTNRNCVIDNAFKIQ